MPDESKLIDRAQKGDREALNELVSIYWHPTYRLICYKIINSEDAQELTQETFFRAFRSLPNYRETGATFKTYLGHIALNLVRDFWRKQGRRPEILELNDYQEPVSDEDQPDTQVINAEKREAIAAVLKELPEEQRQTIELRILAGLPIRDTAIAMNKTEAAIKMLQQRALKNLRSLLLDKKIIETDDRR